MEPLILDRPPTVPTLPGDDGWPPPPGAARAESLIEAVGVLIFLALLIGAVVIMIRHRWR